MKKLVFITLIIAFCGFSAKAQTSLNTAVDFQTVDCHGNPFHLFDILDGGQYVLIDFFYANCGPCQLATPKIAQAYELLGCNQHDIFFVEISDRDSDAACINWANTYGIEYPTISNQSGSGGNICNTYGIPAFPTVILIAPNKSIVIKDLWPINNSNTIITAVGAQGVLPHECAPSIEPINLVVSANYNIVTLTWEEPDETTNLIGYNVFRDNVLIAENIEPTEYSEESEGGDFEYCVTAVFSDTESEKVCANISVVFCDAAIELMQLFLLKYGYGVLLTWYYDINFSHSGEFLFYNIYRDGELIATTTENMYFDEDPPNGISAYVVSAVFSDGCESFSNEIDGIPVYNSINDHNSTYTIYPNPAKDYITIDYSVDTNIKQDIQIYNSIGNLMLQEKISTKQIDISNLAPGLYLIKINNIQYKFVKQ